MNTAIQKWRQTLVNIVDFCKWGTGLKKIDIWSVKVDLDLDIDHGGLRHIQFKGHRIYYDPHQELWDGTVIERGRLAIKVTSVLTLDKNLPW